MLKLTNVHDCSVVLNEIMMYVKLDPHVQILAVLVQLYSTSRLFNGKCLGADHEGKNWTEDVVGEG